MANLVGLKLIKLRAIQIARIMFNNGLFEDAAYYITVFGIHNYYSIPLLIKNLTKTKEPSLDVLFSRCQG